MARKNKLRLGALDKAPSRSASRPPGRTPSRPGGRGAPPPSWLQDADDDRMETAGFVVGSLFVVIILIGLAVVFGTRKIEEGVAADVQALLFASEIRDVDVSASGLDVSLRGVVGSETLLVNVPKAVESNFPWIRSLDVELRVVLPPEANEIEITPDSLTFEWTADAVTVVGTMSNQSTVDAITTTLSSAFESVEASDLVVRDGVPSESSWMTAVLRLMTDVAADVPEGKIIVNPNGRVVQFAAEFETRQERADVRDAAEKVLATTTFDFSSGLTLITTAPTTTAAPEVVVEVQKQFDDTITGKSVEFESGSAVLTAVGRELLDELLITMLEFPEVPILVEGHTDSDGSEESNLDLSRRRAEAVVAYLVDNGAESDRFVVRGLGESEPIADNDTVEGKARNRRIVFTALAE